MSPLYCEFNVHRTRQLEGFIKAVFSDFIFPLKLPVTLPQASLMEAPGHNKKIFLLRKVLSSGKTQNLHRLIFNTKRCSYPSHNTCCAPPYPIIMAVTYPNTLWVDSCTKEGSLPAVHLLLGLTGQLQLPVVLVNIPDRKTRISLFPLPTHRSAHIRQRYQWLGNPPVILRQRHLVPC